MHNKRTPKVFLTLVDKWTKATLPSEITMSKEIDCKHQKEGKACLGHIDGKHIGGQPGAGLFRLGPKGRDGNPSVGIMLLQVQLKWNTAWATKQQLFISNTPSRLRTVRSVKIGMIFPALSRANANKIKYWRWDGWFELVKVVYKADDPEEIAKECGKRGSKTTGDNFDVGAVMTWKKVGNPFQDAHSPKKRSSSGSTGKKRKRGVESDDGPEEADNDKKGAAVNDRNARTEEEQNRRLRARILELEKGEKRLRVQITELEKESKEKDARIEELIKERDAVKAKVAVISAACESLLASTCSPA